MSIPRKTALWLVAIALSAGTGVAAAHVKWFMPYDLSEPPRPIGQVITPDFVLLFAISAVAIYTFFLVDRLLYRRGFLDETLGGLVISEDMAFWIMRTVTSILFLSLFVYGIRGQSVYLTPELFTDSAVIPWIHLAMAIVVWHRRTAPLMGAGILLLYVLSMFHYGAFHLLDYLIFPGIAVYFLLAPAEGPTWTKLRYVTLFATTGLTLLWGAIEKLAYPDWTYPLLNQKPALLMGMEPAFYMTLAAFVEFNIVFVLLSSASVFSRFAALGLNTLFILAIFEFGMIDAIGHLVIIAVLVILTVRGPTSARYFLVLPDKNLWTEAYFMTGLYMLALNVMVLAYYGFYFLLH